MSTNVYLSVGRGYTDAYQQFVGDFERHLKAVGLTPQTVGRNYYKNKEPLNAIADCMRECDGAVVLAFERVRIADGADMPGNNEVVLKDARLPTVWNQIEAAMAYSMERPLLVVVEPGLRNEGLLQHGYDWYVVSKPLGPSLFSDPEFTGVLEDWKKQLRGDAERSRAVAVDLDVGQMRLGHMVSIMTLGQIWATLVAIAGLIAGGVTIGYQAGKLSAPAAEARMSTAPAL